MLESLPEQLATGWPEDMPPEIIAGQRATAHRVVDAFREIIYECWLRLSQADVNEEIEQEPTEDEPTKPDQN